jgi:hypothetical protein
MQFVESLLFTRQWIHLQTQVPENSGHWLKKWQRTGKKRLIKSNTTSTSRAISTSIYLVHQVKAASWVSRREDAAWRHELHWMANSRNYSCPEIKKNGSIKESKCLQSISLCVHVYQVKTPTISDKFRLHYVCPWSRPRATNKLGAGNQIDLQTKRIKSRGDVAASHVHVVADFSLHSLSEF